MENSVFTQLSLVLAIAAGVSLVVRLLKQPLIMGYILSGIIVGPSLLNVITNQEAFDSFSQLGVTLLLFIVGLGLNIAVIRSTGRPVAVTFLTVTALVGGVSYFASLILGYTGVEAMLLAVALLFSSTIIVVKALNDKREQSRLYGQIAIGILLVEDVAATIALLFIASAQGGGITLDTLATLTARGILLAAVLGFLGAYVMPRLTHFFAASQEFLFMFALAWGFGVASIFSVAGFSIEVGALFAGVALASLPYASEISARLRPLRDFFVALFFIGLGAHMDLANISSGIIPAIALSIVVLVTKPLIITATLGLLGYTRQVGYKTAIHLSQISEFSIILIVLAQSVGMVSQELISVVTLTAMITITVSTYLMKYDERLYRKFEGSLRIFEREHPKKDPKKDEGYPLILFGYHKGGHEFVNAFREMKRRYVVVDYDPAVIETLEHQHIHHIYGDATDIELLEEIGVNKAKLVVSTITDYVTNKILVQHVMRRNAKAIFICHANDYDDAAKLYEHGATYVMLPHFIGSEQVSSFIKRKGSNKEAFEAYRKRHIITLGKAALAE